MSTSNDPDILRAAVHSGRKTFAIAIGFSFLCNLLRLTGPLFILLIYDRVLPSRSEETLVVLFTLVTAFLITLGMLDYSRRRLLARFGAQFQEHVEEEIFAATPKEEFFKTRQLKPLAGLSDVDAIRGFFNSNAVIAVLDFMWTPMFLVVVFIFHWVLGWVVVGGLALLLALNLVKTYLATGRADRAKSSSGNITDLKNMLLKSRRVMKAQGMAAPFNDRWLEARRSSRDHSIELKDWSAWFSILTRQIRTLLQFSVLAVGAYFVINGKITTGAMIASMFLSVRVFLPVDQLIREWPRIRRMRDNWNFLQNYLNRRSQQEPHHELWDLDAGLRLESLSKRSPVTNKPLLRNINLTAEAGTVLEISGPSGAGKTVLAETIVGALPKNGGSIIVGGTNIERLTAAQAKNLFAYIPETVELVDGTIADNIAGLESEPDMDRVVETARLAGIHEFVLQLPDGYRTYIEAGNEALSRGQTRQLALARALYKQAHILIIDEPDELLQAALKKPIPAMIETTKSIVIVLTRTSIPALAADRRYLLEDGRLKTNRSDKTVVSIEKSKTAKTKSGGQLKP
jgi:ATP-binding cassette subfamily C protein